MSKVTYVGHHMSYQFRYSLDNPLIHVGNIVSVFYYHFDFRPLYSIDPFMRWLIVLTFGFWVDCSKLCEDFLS